METQAILDTSGMPDFRQARELTPAGRRPYRAVRRLLGQAAARQGEVPEGMVAQVVFEVDLANQNGQLDPPLSDDLKTAVRGVRNSLFVRPDTDQLVTSEFFVYSVAMETLEAVYEHGYRA